MADVDPCPPVREPLVREARDNALLYTDEAYFAAEMASLSDSCWQFVGVTDELAQPDDWVRARVYGLDVFVQNFKGELRGFHNVCQHRGFPIRTKRSGNGRVQCGFHAWNYDAHGVPVGVSRNEELFPLSREDKRNLSLTPVCVASAGKFVFVAVSDTVPPLAEYLGRYAHLLELWSGRTSGIRDRWHGTTKANWKLPYEVTLDEYHVNFVHATSFRDVAIPVWGCVYEQEGVHSHLLRRRTADWSFENFWSGVASGEYEFAGYKVHHFFPNMFVVVARHMLLITHFIPVAAGETEHHDTMLAGTEFEVDDATWDETVASQRTIAGEDRTISEAQQSVMGQYRNAPTFGALEERVRWFHQIYQRIVESDARRRLGGR